MGGAQFWMTRQIISYLKVTRLTLGIERVESRFGSW